MSDEPGPTDDLPDNQHEVVRDLPDIPQRLVRIETVTFDGDELVAVVLAGEGVAVPVRVVCLALGIDPRHHAEQLREHDVLSQGLRVVKAPLEGRVRSTLALLHDYIPYWLATISPHQVHWVRRGTMRSRPGGTTMRWRGCASVPRRSGCPMLSRGRRRGYYDQAYAHD